MPAENRNLRSLHPADVDALRVPVVGHQQQMLGGVDDVGGYAEHPAVHVGTATREAAERRVRAGQTVRRLVDGAVAAERNHYVVALASRLAPELGGVVAPVGVDRVDLVAAPQRVDDEVLEPVRDGRRVRVDHDQHAPIRRAATQGKRRLEALERISGRSGHGDLQHRDPALVTRSCRLVDPNIGRLESARSLTNVWIYCASHSCTHQEGWRDWPYETPATSRKGKVPIPSGSNDKPGRCG